MGLGYTQTDLVQQWATYNKNTLRGFVPRYEGPDEFCWNTGYPWGSFGHVVAWIYGSNSCYDWYGASMAVAGKTIFNTVYGLSAPDPTKAWVIVGEQAAGAPSKGGGGQDLKLTATNFVSSWSGYPAYDWVTHTAFAGYWNPLYDYSGYTSSPNGNRLEIAWE